MIFSLKFKFKLKQIYINVLVLECTVNHDYLGIIIYMFTSVDVDVICEPRNSHMQNSADGKNHYCRSSIYGALHTPAHHTPDWLPREQNTSIHIIQTCRSAQYLIYDRSKHVFSRNNSGAASGFLHWRAEHCLGYPGVLWNKHTRFSGDFFPIFLDKPQLFGMLYLFYRMLFCAWRSKPHKTRTSWTLKPYPSRAPP